LSTVAQCSLLFFFPFCLRLKLPPGRKHRGPFSSPAYSLPRFSPFSATTGPNPPFFYRAGTPGGVRETCGFLSGPPPMSRRSPPPQDGLQKLIWRLLEGEKFQSESYSPVLFVNSFPPPPFPPPVIASQALFHISEPDEQFRFSFLKEERSLPPRSA